MCVCPKCTNAYGKANVWDLYDTDTFKIGLLKNVLRTLRVALSRVAVQRVLLLLIFIPLPVWCVFFTPV